VRWKESAVGAADCKGSDLRAAKWRAFGEGSIDRRYLAVLKEIELKGSISQHFEYDTARRGTADCLRNAVAAMKKDLATIRRWIEEAQTPPQQGV